MVKVLEYVLKYTLLFGALYLCSIIVVNIFKMFGLTFASISDAAFIAALLAMIFLHLIKYIMMRNKSTRNKKTID